MGEKNTTQRQDSLEELAGILEFKKDVYAAGHPDDATELSRIVTSMLDMIGEEATIYALMEEILRYRSSAKQA